MTVDQIKKAIDAFFSDTSRSRDATRSGLEDIIEHAETLSAALWNPSPSELPEDDGNEIW